MARVEEEIVKAWMSLHYWGKLAPYDLQRHLIIVTVHASDGRLSGVVLSVEGTPPKGTIFCQVQDFSNTWPHIKLQTLVFVGNGDFKGFKASSGARIITDVEALLNSSAMATYDPGLVEAMR